MMEGFSPAFPANSDDDHPRRSMYQAISSAKHGVFALRRVRRAALIDFSAGFMAATIWHRCHAQEQKRCSRAWPPYECVTRPANT